MNRRQFLLAPLAPHNHSNTTAELSQPPTAPKFASPPSLERYDGPWDRSTVLHLLRRALLGPSVRDVREAMTMSMDALVAKLTAPVAGLPAPPPRIGAWMDNPTTFFNSDRLDLTLALDNEIRRWWCGLMVEDGLSVRERMTLFWHNHFPIDASVCFDPRYVYLQNQLFRRHALGNFKQLVRDITVDKGMLYYLDGKLNKKGKELNENYARELQELFTIGVADNNGTPNYTQQDVYEVARVLTGWGFWGAGITGDVDCPPWFGHDPTDKVVYGKVIKGREYGEDELDDLLDIIFDREETPRYIVRKLYRFFVYTDTRLTPFSPITQEIEDAIIAPLAREFRSSNWDTGHVLRVLFSSRHFYDAHVMGACIKSPIDHLAGTARAFHTGASAERPSEFLLESLHVNANELGQWLLVPPGVQGWSFYRSWISGTTLPMRHTFTDRLIDGGETFYYDVIGALDAYPEKTFGVLRVNTLAFARQFDSFADDPEQLIREIAEHFLAYPATPRLLNQLSEALLQGQPAYEWSYQSEAFREARLKGMLKFLMRSANYQLM